MTTGSHRRRGFTMLELLIALAIMAMIAAALASTIGLGSRVWQRASSYPASDAHVLLRSHLRHWVETAKPPARLIGLRQQFTGTPDKLVFVTTTRIPGGVAGTEARVTLQMAGEPESAGQQITLTIDWLDSERRVKATETRSFIGNVKNATLRYFERDREGGSGAWHDQWEAVNRLPDLIALEVESAELVWPPLIIAPKLR